MAEADSQRHRSFIKISDRWTSSKKIDHAIQHYPNGTDGGPPRSGLLRGVRKSQRLSKDGTSWPKPGQPHSKRPARISMFMFFTAPVLWQCGKRCARPCTKLRCTCAHGLTHVTSRTRHSTAGPVNRLNALIYSKSAK